MGLEDLGRKQLHDVPPFADHDLGIERQPPGKLGPQVAAANRLPDYECPRRPDTDHVEVLQRRGERRGPEPSVTADVGASDKNNNSHDWSTCSYAMASCRAHSFQRG
jgi:hypothetical protein